MISDNVEKDLKVVVELFKVNGHNYEISIAFEKAQNPPNPIIISCKTEIGYSFTK